MTVTIEKTSKKYKARYLVSILIICIGTVLMIAGESLWGLNVTLAGLIFYFVTRFGAWWNHS